MHYGLRVNSELKGPTDLGIKEGRGIALSLLQVPCSACFAC